MPNLTTPIPPKLTGRTEDDLKRLKEWGTALIDELSYLFNNLGSANVKEAASVKAENIDTSSAKISSAQIGALTADKLIAGTVDTNKVTVADEKRLLELTGSSIILRDGENERFIAAYNKDGEAFQFILCNSDGEPTVSINSIGDAVFRGTVESSQVFGSTIIGTDSYSYLNKEGGVFVLTDPAGMKIMQDKNNARKQKIGMSVADDGTAYMVLGTGNGTETKNVNGVVYSNGAFKIEKNESCASMGLAGYSPFVYFWEDNGELWLSGKNVLINGTNVLKKIEQLENEIMYLKNF